MEKLDLNQSLRTILRPAHVNAAKRAGIETLAEFARVIEQFGLQPSHQRDGTYFFADYKNGPGLRYFGVVAWTQVLQALEAAGFDWRQHLVNPYASGKLSKQTTTALRLAINRNIEALVELLREYQLRNADPKTDTLNSGN